LGATGIMISTILSLSSSSRIVGGEKKGKKKDATGRGRRKVFKDGAHSKCHSRSRAGSSNSEKRRKRGGVFAIKKGKKKKGGN